MATQAGSVAIVGPAQLLRSARCDASTVFHFHGKDTDQLGAARPSAVTSQNTDEKATEGVLTTR
jgi:hypothetical protein